jgi:predicted  nucleic acid-binding Zn-ribbon protein
MKKDRILIVLIILLLLALLGSYYWGNQQKTEKEQLMSENAVLTEAIGGLGNIKKELETEVDRLMAEYEALAAENESLEGSLAKAKADIAKKAAEIRNAKASSTAEVNSLRAEIQNLMAIKAELENNIQAMQVENDSLRARTGVLEQDLSLAKEDIAALNDLNNAIQQEVRKLTLANFKASAFDVVVGQKNDKVTARSRRARKITVNFELMNVPNEYQGVRPLYLSITDTNGVPVNATNPYTTKVTVNGQPMDLIAVDAKEVDLIDNQRLSLSYDVDEKLQAGFYRATVYTDIGLLGAVSFKLR